MAESRQAFSDQLLQLLQAAEDEFLRQANGKSLCEIGKCGDNSLTLKFAEGKMQALRDINRAVNKSAGDDMQLQLLLQQLEQRWRQLSEISASWQSYKNAGLAEIAAALAVLATLHDGAVPI